MVFKIAIRDALMIIFIEANKIVDNFSRVWQTFYLHTAYPSSFTLFLKDILMFFKKARYPAKKICSRG